MIVVSGRTVSETWERAFLDILDGTRDRVPTEYDNGECPPSVDDVCLMEVTEPMSEPRVHLCMPGGWKDLVDYVAEVVEGSRDHLVDQLGYTYHDRLTNYPGKPYIEIGDEDDDGNLPRKIAYWGVDQLERIVRMLKSIPYSRRAQAITWVPEIDLLGKDIPCLQSVQCRIINRSGTDMLDMHVRFRSRDAYQAAFMNMYALTMLQAKIAGELGVPVGHYVDFSDSFHVYGYKLEEAMGYRDTILRRRESGGTSYITTEDMESRWE
jgi:thymidylate synthase